MTDQAAFETQAEEDANAVMVRVEAGHVQDARDVVSEIAADGGVHRLAWLVMQLAAGLHAQEIITAGLERMVNLTRGIEPAGISRETVARIALESDERRENQPRPYSPRLME